MKISKKGKIKAGTRFDIDDDVFDIQGKKEDQERCCV